MTTASNQTYSDPYLTKLRDSRKKSIGVEFMVNPEYTYTMRKMAALKGFTEAQTQPRISELLTDGVIKVVSQRTDQIMKSKVSVYQFVKCEDRADVEPEKPVMKTREEIEYAIKYITADTLHLDGDLLSLREMRMIEGMDVFGKWVLGENAQFGNDWLKQH